METGRRLAAGGWRAPPDCRICKRILEVLMQNPKGLGLNELAEEADFARGTCAKHLSDLKAEGMVVSFSGKGGKEPNFAFQHAYLPLNFWSEKFWILSVTIRDVGVVSREIKEARTPELRRDLILDVVNVVRGRYDMLFSSFVSGSLFRMREIGPWSEEFDELYRVVQSGYEDLMRRFLDVTHVEFDEISRAEYDSEGQPQNVRANLGHRWTEVEDQPSDDLEKEWRTKTPMEIKRLIEELIEKALPD